MGARLPDRSVEQLGKDFAGIIADLQRLQPDDDVLEMVHHFHGKEMEKLQQYDEESDPGYRRSSFQSIRVDCITELVHLIEDAIDAVPADQTPEPSAGPTVDEIGCAYNMITGEHYGECKGTCGNPDTWADKIFPKLNVEAEEWETLLTIPAPFGRIKLERLS